MGLLLTSTEFEVWEPEGDDGLGAPDREGSGERMMGEERPEEMGVWMIAAAPPGRREEELEVLLEGELCEELGLLGSGWDDDERLEVRIVRGLLGGGRSKVDIMLGTGEPGLVERLDVLEVLGV